MNRALRFCPDFVGIGYFFCSLNPAIAESQSAGLSRKESNDKDHRMRGGLIPSQTLFGSLQCTDTNSAHVSEFLGQQGLDIDNSRQMPPYGSASLESRPRGILESRTSRTAGERRDFAEERSTTVNDQLSTTREPEIPITIQRSLLNWRSPVSPVKRKIANARSKVRPSESGDLELFQRLCTTATIIPT